jgi:hypothetical protein
LSGGIKQANGQGAVTVPPSVQASLAGSDDLPLPTHGIFSGVIVVTYSANVIHVQHVLTTYISAATCMKGVRATLTGVTLGGGVVTHLYSRRYLETCLKITYHPPHFT